MDLFIFFESWEERKLLTSIFIDLLPSKIFHSKALSRYPSTTLNNDKCCEINNEFIVSNVHSAAFTRTPINIKQESYGKFQ